MEHKRKIIVVHENGSTTGGSAKIAIETAIGLSLNGAQVAYFCATSPIDNKLREYVNRIVCLNQKDIASEQSRIKAIKNGIWNQKAYSMLSRLIKEYGQNTVVHIHGWSHVLSASIFKACRDNNIVPYVTLHDYFCVCPNGGLYNYPANDICGCKPMSLQCVKCNCDSRSYAHKIFRIIRQVIQDRYVRNNPDINYIYISKFSLSKMQSYLRSDRFYYLHNPVDYYNIDTIEAKENNKYVYIGRISPEKGVDIFCEAVTRLKRPGVVIGDGYLKEKLSKEYPTIEFVGWKSKQEIIPYLRQSRCLVFPSKCFEGAPLTTDECMNVGIPCIVSDQCAAVDQITDGVNGYTFKSKDVHDLMDKLLALDNSRELFDLSRWGLRDYSLRSYIENLNEIYRK